MSVSNDNDGFAKQTDRCEDALAWAEHLEIDIDYAAKVGVPVLISGPLISALAIVGNIAARSSRAGTPEILICDLPYDDVLAVVADGASAGSDDRSAPILLLREVHTLGKSQQTVVRKLVEDWRTRPRTGTPRVIATSSIDLFDRVVDGSFDERLFYQLNVIHIVVSGDA